LAFLPGYNLFSFLPGSNHYGKNLVRVEGIVNTDVKTGKIVLNTRFLLLYLPIGFPQLRYCV